MEFISKQNFADFVKGLYSEYDIFYPKKNSGGGRDWAKWQKGDEFSLEGHRTVLPVKYFFYSPQENLVAKQRRPLIIFGARGCDTRGLELLKKIYLDDPKDPYFRKDILIFTADCTSAHSDCFCSVLGAHPWAEKDFDLNFSPLGDGCLIEAGSEKGKEILRKNSEKLEDVSETHKKEQARIRAAAEKIVNGQNNGVTLDMQKLKGKIETRNSAFENHGKTCVSCSACTTVCPACFCFFLSEGKENKIRYTDSCQLPGYARVAGGANPKKELISRFMHRFGCKFSWRPSMHNNLGCTGCGRCISGCQGKINFKEVLIEVSQ